MERQDCPNCHAVCQLLVTVNDDHRLTLLDRMVFYGTLPVTVECPDCHWKRLGVIEDIEISKEGVLAGGEFRPITDWGAPKG